MVLQSQPLASKYFIPDVNYATQQTKYSYWTRPTINWSLECEGKGQTLKSALDMLEAGSKKTSEETWTYQLTVFITCSSCIGITMFMSCCAFCIGKKSHWHNIKWQLCNTFVQVVASIIILICAVKAADEYEVKSQKVTDYKALNGCSSEYLYVKDGAADKLNKAFKKLEWVRGLAFTILALDITYFLALIGMLIQHKKSDSIPVYDQEEYYENEHGAQDPVWSQQY